jgi:hypothetical protein
VERDKVRVVHKCPGVYVHKIARGAGGTLVAAASKGKVFFSKDGVKWSKLKVPGGRDYQAVVFHGGRFLVGGSKGTLLEVDSEGKATELPTKGLKMSGDGDQILGFAPMGEGVLVLAGREMGSSMNRRGVAIALGDLGGHETGAAAKEEAFVLPAPRKRTPPAALPGRPPTQYETLTPRDAKARFKGLLAPESPPTEVRVFPSMRVARLELVAEPGESFMIVVDGDLYVDGAMTVASCEDDDSYVTVHVTGKLSAENLVLFLDPRVNVKGDVDVADLVACGEGRAFLDVGGRLTCRLAIAASPGCITAKKGLAGMAVGDRETFGGVKEIQPEETAFRVLLPKFVDTDTSALKPREVYDALRKDKRVTR